MTSRRGCGLCRTDSACRPCAVYVVADRSGAGPVKVGISFHPVRRLAQHRKKTRADIGLFYSRKFRCEYIAMRVEEKATGLLNPLRHHGDWFSCSVTEAINAVERAAK